MAGEHEKLEETLNQLQLQLDALRQTNPQAAAQLQATVNQAKSALAGGAIQPAAHQSIVDSLNDELLKVEASHPTLAQGLGRIVDALAQMGI